MRQSQPLRTKKSPASRIIAGRRERASKASAACAAAVLAALGARSAYATNPPLFYDDNGAAGISNVAGPWDTATTSNWNPAADGSGTVQLWNQGSDATFGTVSAGTITITLGNPITAGSLAFTNIANAYTLTGNTTNTLTLNSGLITPTAAGGSQTLNINITVPSGSLTVANNTTGSASNAVFGGSANSVANAANAFGDLILGGSANGFSSGSRNQATFTTPGSLPSSATTTIKFQRDWSNLAFGSSGNFNNVHVSNPMILNSSGISPATKFTALLGSNGGQIVIFDGAITGPGGGIANADLQIQAGVGGNSGGLGVLLINAQAKYDGATIFNNGAAATTAIGCVRLGGTDYLPTTTSIRNTPAGSSSTTNTGAFDLNGFNQTIASLGSNTTGVVGGVINGSATSTAGSPSILTIKGNVTAAYKGNIGALDAAAGITGVNQGGTYNEHIRLVLDAANTGKFTATRAGGLTYDGGTIIDGGTMIVSNTSGSGTGSGTVTVGTGGTLGGGGFVAGPVTSSGKLSPGTSVGTLTITGGATLNAGSGVDLEFDNTPVHDQINVTGGTLTLPGSGTANLNLIDLNTGIHNTTGSGAGVNPNYVLFNYSGATLSGTPATAFTIVPPATGGAQFATFGLNTTGTAIELTVSGVGNDITWTGDIAGSSGSGTWDTTSSRWTTPGTFSTNDLVTFNDSAAGTGDMTVTVDAGGVSPTVATVNNTSRSYTLTGGAITGGGSIIKNGTGTLTLNASNTFTGGVVVNQGTVHINSDTALGAVPGSASMKLTIAKTTSTNSTFFVFDEDMTLAATRTVKLGQTSGGGPVISALAGKTVTIAGDITGSGSGVNFVFGDVTHPTQTGTINLRGNNGTNVGGGYATAMFIKGGTVNVISDSNFGSSSTGAAGAAVTLNATLGVLQFGGSFTWNAARTINFSSSADGDGGFIDTAGFDQSVSGTVGGNGHMTKMGNGTLTLTGSLTHSGAASVTGGKLLLQTNYLSPASVTADNATVELAAGSGNNLVIKTPTVAVLNGGRIDVQDNKLILTAMSSATYTGTYPTGSYDATSVVGMVKAGREPISGGFPQWNGSGIVTSQSNARPSHTLTTLGVATGKEVKGVTGAATATWGVQTVHENDVLVMYTYGGDGNLDGKIDVDDYFLLDSNFSKSTTVGFTPSYNKGDFNYDGLVDGGDYALIDANYVNQASQINTSAPLGGGLGGVTAVPEPASIALLALAAAGLFARRRRAH